MPFYIFNNLIGASGVTEHSYGAYYISVPQSIDDNLLQLPEIMIDSLANPDLEGVVSTRRSTETVSVAQSVMRITWEQSAVHSLVDRF